MKKLIAGLGLASSLAACGPAIRCVARGSRVKTPTGPRPIEDLKVGDEIVVADPETGLTAVSRLEAVIMSTRECGTFRFSGRALSVTSDHPLYDPLARGFFPAGDWLLGLRTHLYEITDAGAAAVRVETFETFSRVDDVFDLTVAHEWHTFIAEGVLVHNKQPASCSIPDGGFTTLGTADELRPGCACMDGGVGRWTCGGSGGLALCQFCAAQDGGP